jgi:CRISPR/Cas system CSM-associated protein Csm3 (group 7 of RAMP superfamily)
MTEQRHKSNRYIVERIIVRGTLVLDTPTSLGSGDADSPTDLPLLRDSISNHALLTGSSIAGALRNYLRERSKGYGESDSRQDIAAKLFGDLFAYRDEKDEKDKNEAKKIQLIEQDTQSSIIIDDAISTQPINAELRDGVKIDSIKRTAEEGKKYDLELLQAGTEFPLCLELLIEREANQSDLLKALAIVLSGLEKGEISLGMKKRRGFGRCHVKQWQVWQFDLTKDDQRWQWLTFEHWHTGLLPNHRIYPSIQEAFSQAKIEEVDFEKLKGEDERDRFLLHATFNLVGSLLIRSSQDSTGRAPDVVHLKSHRPNETNPVSVLSGTSLAGVLRHRAERIVKTLGSCSPIVDKLFGFVVGKQSQSSRLVVHEKVIKDATDLVQTRIAIDRFTGGAYHGALFDEQPIFGGNDTIVTLELELRKPEEHEIGLLLLLLKDLWTQDLPVGGESSIGRGRLQGKKATLTCYKWDKEKNLQQKETWTIKQCDPDQPLQISDSDREKLKNFVSEFVTYIGKGEKP